MLCSTNPFGTIRVQNEWEYRGKAYCVPVILIKQVSSKVEAVSQAGVSCCHPGCQPSWCVLLSSRLSAKLVCPAVIQAVTQAVSQAAISKHIPIACARGPIAARAVTQAGVSCCHPGCCVLLSPKLLCLSCCVLLSPKLLCLSCCVLLSPKLIG